jgi:hypothetical protein
MAAALDDSNLDCSERERVKEEQAKWGGQGGVHKGADFFTRAAAAGGGG